ncbi:MAG: alpha/beta hydrolase [Bryocella sp.]
MNTLLRDLTMSFVLAAVSSAGMLSAQKKPLQPIDSQKLETPVGITEVGMLDGAQYRIDIPNDWNHSLVVYYHGYSTLGVHFNLAHKLGKQQQPFFQRRYAVVQSAYSKSGWAVHEAYTETEALRRYFLRKYGKPVETIVAGESMGGTLVMITIEQNPKPYNGGLDLCGSVGPTFESFEHRFAMRAAFDYYFPGLMGSLVPVPLNYEVTPAVNEKILAALAAHPNEAAQLRRLLALHTDREVAHAIAYYTFVVKDMQLRSAGNPFDNRNYLYSGTSENSTQGDYALNDGVRRYAANQQAAKYLYAHYMPTGKLTKPMLALHTIYDPTVPTSAISLYGHLVQLAGYSQNLVQQYVHREGHCTFSQEEKGQTFDELLDWTRHGIRPTPGLLESKPSNTVSSKEFKVALPKKQ